MPGRQLLIIAMTVHVKCHTNMFEVDNHLSQRILHKLLGTTYMSVLVAPEWGKLCSHSTDTHIPNPTALKHVDASANDAMSVKIREVKGLAPHVQRMMDMGAETVSHNRQQARKIHEKSRRRLRIQMPTSRENRGKNLNYERSWRGFRR